MDVLEKLKELSDYEEINELHENYLQLVTLVHDALEAEKGGEVTSDDVDLTIAQAIEDHAQNQLDIFGIEVQVEFEGESDFADALEDLIDKNYEDPDEGVAELSQVAGVTPEEIQAYAMGLAAPSPEVVRAIADYLLADNEEKYQGFLLLGQDAYSEAMASMSAAPSPQEAQFNEIRQEREVGFRLRQLEKFADGLESQNILTPAERNSLLRSTEFSQDVDSVAVFSTFCNNSGVDPHIYLDQVEFCLNWKQQCGPSNYGAFFSSEVVEAIDTDAEQIQEAKEFVADFRSRHSYQ